MRRRLSSRPRFRVFWEAGRDKSHWICSPNGLGSRPLVDIFRSRASARDLPCFVVENFQSGGYETHGFSQRLHSLSMLWAPDTLTDFKIYTHTCIILEGFEAESFLLKYNPTTSECKVHSIEVDLHYFK